MINSPNQKIRLDYNNMMQEFVGSYGFTADDFAALEEKVIAATAAMKMKRKQGLMDWRDLPHNQAAVVDEILAYAAENADKFEAFVLLGIGGSALGPMAVQQAINHQFYNELPREKRGGYPKFYVVDNVDPERLACLFDIIEVDKCLFNVVSKSGSTSETMSQFMIIKQMLEDKLGVGNVHNHIVCTTDKDKGNLIKIAQDEGYKTFIIPSGVGGRFSQLTPVGLLSAAFTGIDIRGLLAGAAYMDELCAADDIAENPAHMYGLLNYIAMQRGMPMSVMMPYADSLKYISDWYAQLWAESLGKKHDNDGNVVNVGPTPIRALGATDQHSQVQLYVEGPYDKIVVLIGVDEYRKTVTIPKTYGDISSLGFLGGATHNELIIVEQLSTEHALRSSGRPNMTITLPSVNEFTVGQLLYMFKVATAFAGELMNINAFDQPGVEEGKNATYAMFGRPGYEDKKDELDSRPEKKSSYIIG